jgi:hypothetical protein
MLIGCVTTVFLGTSTAGIKPEGCGGLIAGAVPKTVAAGLAPDGVASGGGVWIFGGVPGGVFATVSGGCGGFLSFLPKEKKAIEGTPAWKACQG